MASSPEIIQKFEDLNDLHILNLNRNARKPTRANHGARPCSSFMRKLKIKGWYTRRKDKIAIDPEDRNIRNIDGFEEEREAKKEQEKKRKTKD